MALSRDEVEQSVEFVEKLYPFAGVLAQVAVLAQNTESQVEEMGKLMRQDAGLTADVLSLANSAFYSFSEPAADIETAIGRLGYNEIVKLIGLVLAKKVFSQDLNYYGLKPEEIWGESVSRAFIMESLAKLTQLDFYGAYTTGIMSSIGKVVMNELANAHGFDDECESRFLADVLEWERKHTNHTHADTGAFLLGKWEFPERIIEVVTHQYRLSEVANSDDIHPYVWGINFSVKVVDQLGVGFVNETLELDDEMELYMEHFQFDEENLLKSLLSSYELYQESYRQFFGAGKD